jgi:hypothetical protein
MAENLDYAREIIRFSRERALADGHADLAEWAGKLEQALASPEPAQPKPLVEAAAGFLRDRGYVGRLR